MLLIFSSLLQSGGGGSGPSSWPIDANWKLIAARAPLVGDFNPVTPFHRVPFSIDFSAQIPAGDTLVSATGAIAAYYGADPNAGALVWGTPATAGSIVTQWGGPGWLSLVIYRLTLTAQLGSGGTIPLYAHIACNSLN